MIIFDENGWHGVISDSITFENISIVAQAVADYLNSFRDGNSKVVVGYDTRFLSREYALAIQRVLTGNDVSAYLHKKPVPTSVLSFSTRVLDADLGIMVTGEGRPARFSGLTFKTKTGSPVDGPFMNNLFNFLYRRYPRQEHDRNLQHYVSMVDYYFNYIAGKILLDFNLLKGKLIVYDSFYGSIGSLPESFLRDKGVQCLGIRTKPNPSFQDSAPKPNERNIQPLIKLVLQRKAAVGFFYNGDGSQLGVVDNTGQLIEESLVSALLLTEWKRLSGDNFSVITDIATPFIASDILKHNNIEEIPARSYKEDSDGSTTVVWDGRGLRFNSVVPDRDSLFQSILFLSALARYNFDYKRMTDEIISITGHRFASNRLINFDEKGWQIKRDKILNLDAEILKGFSCREIEEDRAIKIHLENKGFILFDYNSLDKNVLVALHTIYEEGIDEKFAKLVKWVGAI